VGKSGVGKAASKSQKRRIKHQRSQRLSGVGLNAYAVNTLQSISTVALMEHLNGDLEPDDISPKTMTLRLKRRWGFADKLYGDYGKSGLHDA
jgi:hypothetical protein